MLVPHRVIAVVVLTAMLCPRAYGPIFGFYPGLHSLIKQSELIAAVTILEKLSEDGFGGSARYRIQFDKLLKGNAPEKQAVVYLRYLEIIPEAELLRSTSLSHHRSPTTSLPPNVLSHFVFSLSGSYSSQKRGRRSRPHTRTSTVRDRPFPYLHSETLML
jgi:hypothetical protein